MSIAETSGKGKQKTQGVRFRPVKSIPARRGRPNGSKYDDAIRAAEGGRIHVENSEGLNPQGLYATLYRRINQLGAPVRVCLRGQDIYLERV